MYVDSVTFFESLLVLLLAAIILLQVSRRLSLPYPAMLAIIGVVVAFIPGSPTILLDPQTTLALFIAPAIVDAAFDFPPGAARKYWLPLIVLAVVAVLATAGVITALGVWLVGLPLSAALALGAIVAPPDAAAATAVLGSVSIPKSSEQVLVGESLFNDATALLLFSAAVAVQQHGGLSRNVGIQLSLAAPGGLLLGLVCAWVMRHFNRFVRDSLGGNLLQFVSSFLIWILAEHLHLSPVLCVIAYAMTLARTPELRSLPRMRVQSYAVWSAVVFSNNVLAFLLMGMQWRVIVREMRGTNLRQVAVFAGCVVCAVIVTRMVVIVSYNRVRAWWNRRQGKPEPASLRQALLVGWCGMRGFVTLATALALPANFPRRDVVVLAAFSVVIVTLVVQGLSLAPMIRLLRLDESGTLQRELSFAREGLANVALKHLQDESGTEANTLRFHQAMLRDAAACGEEAGPLRRFRSLALSTVSQQRRKLEDIRVNEELSSLGYLTLQEELDWYELTLLPDDDRRIEES